MQFSHPFDEYQSSFLPFGMDTIIPEATQPFAEDQDSLFHEMPSGSFSEEMPSVYIPSDYPADTSSFTTETGSPVLPSSVSSSESRVSGSPLSSPDDGSSLASGQETAAFAAIDMSSTDASPNSLSLAPERKKKRQASDAKSPKNQRAKQQRTGKKRKAQSDLYEEMNMERLLTLSSVELEDLRQRLQLEGQWTADDEKILSEALRKVKNKESASNSRGRKRYELDCAKAELSHERLVSSSLREYANMLKSMLYEHGIEVPAEPEIPALVLPPPPPSTVIAKGTTPSRHLRTAGICLMVVVFAFGFLYMYGSSSGASISSVEGNSDNNIVTQSQPVDPSGHVIVEGKAPVGQLQPAPESNSEIAQSSNSESGKLARGYDSVASLDLMRKSTYLSYATDKADSSLALVVREQKQQVPTPSVSTLVPASCPVMRYATKAIFGGEQPHVADQSWCFDNTSYILVNDAAEFVPRTVSTSSLQTRTEPVIGLLLPASSFNISNTAPDDVVELICGVRNANVVPRSVLAHSL